MIITRSALDNIYSKLEDLIDPGIVNSEHVYAQTVRSKVKPGFVWLDVGCGHGIFPSWLPSASTAVDLVKKCKLVVGLDYDFESLTKHDSISNLVRGDFAQAPYRDNSFDCITANMVVEHVSNPVEALETIERLLKPNGIFIFHTPNYWHYWTLLCSVIPQGLKNKLVEIADGRKEEDVFPAFYRLNTVSGIKRAASRAGLRVREFHTLSSSSSGTIAMLGPFVLFDLLLRRLSRYKPFENFRANFIVVLEKPAGKASVVSEKARKR